MCLFKVKEEEEVYPTARVKRVTRVRRYSPPPPERLEQRTSYYHEERRAPPPPAPPSTVPPPPSTHRAETVRSRRTSRAPSVRSTTRSHYVEVENEDDDSPSSSPSSSSSSEDIRSRATSHQTRKTAKSVAPPASEYSIHEREKEIRRERGYAKPREEFETYRYVNAPPGAAGAGGPKEGYRRERERIVIEDGYGRRDRDYRR
ncbi:hypothetical protein B0A55_03128 [Friedmanniomyces simplex]|uniref:Uncharacterized protein n=1 Tax=Friedmanniomyces simplex TaxID=329884 RepID=A0A4U0XK63_9PEZI|nr:hypothetical protein B0A55_03128 [Friedmanniomyces simplex]